MANIGDKVNYLPFTDDVRLSGSSAGVVVNIHSDDTVDIALAALSGESIVRTKVALDAGATAYNSYSLQTQPLAASDTAYNATSWNGSAVPPTKNAVRDMIETLKTDNSLT